MFGRYRAAADNDDQIKSHYKLIISRKQKRKASARTVATLFKQKRPNRPTLKTVLTSPFDLHSSDDVEPLCNELLNEPFNTPNEERDSQSKILRNDINSYKSQADTKHSRSTHRARNHVTERNEKKRKEIREEKKLNEISFIKLAYRLDKLNIIRYFEIFGWHRFRLSTIIWIRIC